MPFKMSLRDIFYLGGFLSIDIMSLTGQKSISMVNGHWSMVIGHWSLVIGHWSLDTALVFKILKGGSFAEVMTCTGLKRVCENTEKPLKRLLEVSFLLHFPVG